MKRYFERAAESELGDGIVYFEFEGERPTRQVEQYGNGWFSSRSEYHAEIGPGLIDQPLSALDLRMESEISAEQFEAAWLESAKHRG